MHNCTLEIHEKSAQVDRSTPLYNLLKGAPHALSWDRRHRLPIPEGRGEGGLMRFVRLGETVLSSKLGGELANHHLAHLVDPLWLAHINVANPCLAKTHPNGMQWWDKESERFFCILFYANEKKSKVSVRRCDGWNESFWLPVQAFA